MVGAGISTCKFFFLENTTTDKYFLKAILLHSCRYTGFSLERNWTLPQFKEIQSSVPHSHIRSGLFQETAQTIFFPSQRIIPRKL